MLTERQPLLIIVAAVAHPVITIGAGILMKMTKSGRSVARNKPLKCVNLVVINLDVDKKYGSKNK
jgi:hypothetical protein